MPDAIKKVGAYTNWLIKQWMSLQQKADAEYAYGSPDWGVALERHQDLFWEDLYKTTEDLEKFHYLKKTKKYKGQKDIGQIKSIEALAIVHFAQTLTYLRLSGLKLALLINFNNKLLKERIHRIVNNL